MEQHLILQQSKWGGIKKKDYYTVLEMCLIHINYWEVVCFFNINVVIFYTNNYVEL